MTSSEVKSGLAAALAAFQAEVPNVTKTKEAEVQGTTRNGDRYKYKYKYADIADVTAVVMPLLGKHGLSFTCQPTIREDGKYGLAYQLLHSSGEMIEGFYPMDVTLRPQDKGGEITYARRYCLSAVTGVAADEDTDARELPKPQEPRQEPQRRPVADDSPYGESGPPQPAEDVAVGEPQIKALADLAFHHVNTPGSTVETLQREVYDEARQHRGWLSKLVAHPETHTVLPLSEIIRDAKQRIESRPQPEEAPDVTAS